MAQNSTLRFPGPAPLSRYKQRIYEDERGALANENDRGKPKNLVKMPVPVPDRTPSSSSSSVGATVRGGPWPPLQYASRSLGPLLCLSIRLYPSFSGPWTRHPAISHLVFLFVLLHTAFRTASFLGLLCLAFFLYAQATLKNKIYIYLYPQTHPCVVSYGKSK